MRPLQNPKDNPQCLFCEHIKEIYPAVNTDAVAEIWLHNPLNTLDRCGYHPVCQSCVDAGYDDEDTSDVICRVCND